jgi:hypothetical protein
LIFFLFFFPFFFLRSVFGPWHASTLDRVSRRFPFCLWRNLSFNF